MTRRALECDVALTIAAQGCLLVAIGFADQKRTHFGTLQHNREAHLAHQTKRAVSALYALLATFSENANKLPPTSKPQLK
jgi:hypothetical protein